MQVDHVVPQSNAGTNDISNLNPSCSLCNHYKRANTLNNFRYWLLGELIERLRKIYIFRVAEKYGMIKVIPWDYKFYYERGNQ